MLQLGIDVCILLFVTVMLFAASFVIALLIPLTKEEGKVMVLATGTTGLVMTITYVIMARVLDAMFPIW